MRTKLNREYECKVFNRGQIKQFALNLAEFCKQLSLEDCTFLTYKDDGFETSTMVTDDDLENICEISAPLNSMAFHYNSVYIHLMLLRHSKNLRIIYEIDGDIKNAKELVSFVENTFELKRLIEEEASELTNEHCHDTPDTSYTKESEVVRDSQAIVQTQRGSDLSNILIDNESTDHIINIWKRTSKILQTLYSIVAYQTWIVPIVPSIDGNQLILNCPDEFVKDWIESRYKKDIIETVCSIESSIEGVIVRVGGKGANQSIEVEKINKQKYLEVNEQLFELMKQVYEKDTENKVGCSVDKYFNQVIQSHCQERMGDKHEVIIQQPTHWTDSNRLKSKQQM